MRRHLPRPALESNDDSTVALKLVHKDDDSKPAPGGDPAAQPQGHNTEVSGDPAAAVSANLPEQTDDLDDFTAEVQEIATLDSMLQDASDVAQGLHEIKAVLSSVPSGHVSEAATTIAAIASEHMAATAGLDLALEAQDKTQPEKLIGKITDGAKKIWESIIAAIRRAVTWVKEFVRKLMDSSAKTKQQAQQLAERAKKTTGQLKSQAIKNAALAHTLSIGGKPVAANDAAKQAHITLLTAAGFLDAVQSKALYDEVFIKSVTGPDAKPVYSPKTLKSIYKTDRVVGGGDKKLEYATSVEMLGGKAITIQLGKETLEGPSAYRMLQHTPYLGNYSSANPSGEELQALSASDVVKIAASAVEMADAVHRFKEAATHLEQLADRLIDAANDVKTRTYSSHPVYRSIQKDNETEAEQYRQELLTAQRSFLSSAPRWLVREPSEMANYLLKTAKALVKYGEASLALVEAPQEAAAGGAAAAA